jgi:outer membrane receptor for Fe3+-dicitrate
LGAGEVGQHQQRTADEWLAQVAHDRVFSSNILGSVRVMARDDGATLSSNADAFPIRASQDRGLREFYANGSLSLRRGRHEIKVGGEMTMASIREQFASTIVDRRPNGIRVFDGDIPLEFSFDARHGDEEQALYAQDLIRLGAVTLSAGLRYDHYALMVDEHAISPRASAAWFIAPADMTLHVTYDRAFQTPAVENILLASSDLVDALGGEGQSLSLRASRANFYEAGLSKAFAGKLRLDANYYYRHGTNFADDELLLNTAVSFPIAFAKGTVKGFEAKIDVPHWGAFSGWISYANARAEGQLPLSGGLFLGDDVTDEITSTETFPISQDQRNTVRGRIRYQATPRIWLGLAAQYNSGLPVEIEGTPNIAVLVAQYGQAVVDRVDFDRGRVKSTSSIDASGGVDLWRTSRGSGRLQLDVFNLTDRLNVINFAGLLSGTALGTGRTVTLRLQAGF